MLEVKRVRDAIQKFNPNQPFWHDARIVEEKSGKTTLETYWVNPELAGVWELRYRVTPKCMIRLLRIKLIEFDKPIDEDAKSYRLSKKGRKRLG